jgi:hypothetical protein
MSLKNSNNTIGNRTRDLPVCKSSALATAPPRAPIKQSTQWNIPTSMLQAVWVLSVLSCRVFGTNSWYVQRILTAKIETFKKLPFNCSWNLPLIVALLVRTFNEIGTTCM